ncbi:MurR/RpiR family transcriptional regulator [Vagococcus sp. BWB3-3]|uniref:MurR/RpiR family transcriptional regulator n=1 Tax=Vagococcus allomyrinae TaxID=2794353 RepID=A0A940P646_9ENTE|nr:MurR/RpiR family transcriptional regulator [Vagococcus allomyrinae]MBP1042319.1 MurR/RpiR family transcriptional regulator [Vagococcus allomyrinae]
MQYDSYKLVNKYKLTETETKILDYLLNNIEDALDWNVRDVARNNFSSPATVMKLAKKMHYTGYIDMVYRLYFAYHRNKESKDEALDISLDQMFSQITSADFQQVIDLLRENQQQVYVCGSGFSRPIAEYISMKLLVLGFNCIFTDLFAVYDHHQAESGLVILISKSGETGNIIKIAEKAQKSHLKIVLMSATRDGRLSELADMTLLVSDENRLDDHNRQHNYFYSGSLFLVEYLMTLYSSE